jgi:hypothetical protein
VALLGPPAAEFVVSVSILGARFIDVAFGYCWRDLLRHDEERRGDRRRGQNAQGAVCIGGSVRSRSRRAPSWSRMARQFEAAFGMFWSVPFKA